MAGAAAYEKPIARRFWLRTDGDWDYFPHANNWGMFGPGYRVTSLTRQLMLDADRQIKRRLALGLVLVNSALFIGGGLRAVKLMDRVPFVNSLLVVAAAMLLVVLGGTIFAAIHLQRRLNGLLQDAPVSTEQYSPERVKAEKRKDGLDYLHQPALRLVLLIAVVGGGFAACNAFPEHIFDTVKYAILSCGAGALLIAALVYGKPS